MYYNEDTSQTFFGIMKNYFREHVLEKGYKVIDMEPVFLEHFKKFRTKFEFPTDGHWNEIAHKLVAEEIISSGFVDNLLMESEDF